MLLAICYLLLATLAPKELGKHKHFALKDYLNLFNTDDEIDIEGMDFADGYLWVTGSHSMKRKKQKKEELETNLDRLATITTDLNRFILARIPVVGGKSSDRRKRGKQQIFADVFRI